MCACNMRTFWATFQLQLTPGSKLPPNICREKRKRPGLRSQREHRGSARDVKILLVWLRWNRAKRSDLTRVRYEGPIDFFFFNPFKLKLLWVL